MSEISFEWDERKNTLNKLKHGISFEEAQTVFYDYNAILFDDPDHSQEEERFLILGISTKEHLCIVSHCYRGKDNIIRLISARKATRSEQAVYTESLQGE
jgi:uncharacterized DUF497 family protein